MFNKIDFHLGPFSFRPIDYLLMATSDDGLTWKKENRSIIEIKYPQRMLYDPFVVKNDEQEYEMYYKFGVSDAPVTGIGLARSRNGKNWGNTQILLKQEHKPLLGSPSVFHLGGKKLFAYVQRGDNASKLIIHEFKDNEVGETKKEISRDSCISSATPLINEDKLKFYITELKNGKSRIVLLKLSEGMDVTGEKSVLTPLEEDGLFQNASVFQENGKIRLYFSESPVPLSLKNVFDGKYRMRIKSAISEDGETFIREGGIRIDTDHQYSTVGCHSPYVFKIGKKYVMVYSGYWGQYLSKIFQYGKVMLRK